MIIILTIIKIAITLIVIIYIYCMMCGYSYMCIKNFYKHYINRLI